MQPRLLSSMSPAVGRAGCPFLQNASSISQGALPVLMQRFRASCPFLASVPAAAPAHGRGVATKMEMMSNNAASAAAADVSSTASPAVSVCPVMAAGRAVTPQQVSSTMQSAANRAASAPSSPAMTSVQKKKQAEVAAQMAAQISLLENQARAAKCPHIAAAKAAQEAAELAANGAKSHAAANPGVHSAEGTFAGKMDSLKAEGRYRVFFDIQRQCGAFPKAYNHSTMRAAEKNLPEEVTVWCNNGTERNKTDGKTTNAIVRADVFPIL